MEHLAEVVRDVERRAEVDPRGLPVGGGDDPLAEDALPGVLHPESLQLLDHRGAHPGRLRLPVDAAALVRGGDQAVEARLPGRGHAGIQRAGVAEVHRGIVAGGQVGGDVLEVPTVVRGEADGVVREVELAVDRHVAHPGAAGVPLALDLAIGPPRGTKRVRDQVLHRPGGVGVDHHVVAGVLAAVHHHPGGLAAAVGDRVHRRPGADGDPHLLAGVAQSLQERVDPALGVPDPVLVLDEGEDREERGALERAHPQVLALEAHREA